MSVRREIVELDIVRLPLAAHLLMRALALTPYAAGAIESVELAGRSPDADARALASVRGSAIDGVIVFGTFAGAVGAGRLRLVVVDDTSRRESVGRSLVEASIAHLRGEGARFVLAELPDDPRALPHARLFLASLDFREESRVENFFRDGVPLVFLRRELAR